MVSPQSRTILVLLALFSCVYHAVVAVVPTGWIQLQFKSPSNYVQSSKLLVSTSSVAGWGGMLPSQENAEWMRLKIPSDPMGCVLQDEDLTSSHLLRTSGVDFAYMVNRGECTFYQKARNAKEMGASGIIIRNTRKIIYDNIIHGNSSRRRRNPFDYDCEHGESFVEQLDNPEWETDDVTCHQQPKCGSETCIPTGQKNSENTKFQLCCMWDLPMLMAANRTLAKDIALPVVFATVHEAAFIDKFVTDHGQNLTTKEDEIINVRIVDRDRPYIDASAFIIWFLGVCTAIGATYYSAMVERRKYHMIHRGYGESDDSHQSEENWDETVDISMKQVFGYIGLACCSLIVLFYIHPSRLITGIYALSVVGALAGVVLYPLVAGCWLPDNDSPRRNAVNNGLQIISLLLSAGLVVFWVFNRDANYAFVLQDLFGMCLCCMFLLSVRLPDLKTGTWLLCLAFFYDIFFVFITPFIFGKSIMEDVATGGERPEEKASYPGVDYCERYPRTDPCKEPESLPMLLEIPHIYDYLGGVAMVGLGDILLPGLLLSFGLRYDYISSKGWKNGYFLYLSISYAIGLMMANIAVYATRMGQPALLYLVPCTLGCMFVLSKRRGEFFALWIGSLHSRIAESTTVELDDKTKDELESMEPLILQAERGPRIDI